MAKYLILGRKIQGSPPAKWTVEAQAVLEGTDWLQLVDWEDGDPVVKAVFPRDAIQGLVRLDDSAQVTSG